MNETPLTFDESELANAIGLLVIRSSELDYLLRSTLAVFIAEGISDNLIYEKAELIVTKFWKVSEVAQLLKDLAPRVLCHWYWEDFNHLFTEVEIILNKRNSHCHKVFHILDEDTYQTSSASDGRPSYTGDAIRAFLFGKLIAEPVAGRLASIQSMPRALDRPLMGQADGSPGRSGSCKLGWTLCSGKM